VVVMGVAVTMVSSLERVAFDRAGRPAPPVSKTRTPGSPTAQLLAHPELRRDWHTGSFPHREARRGDELVAAGVGDRVGGEHLFERCEVSRLRSGDERV
jgi:hypothetical protein